MEEPKLCPEDSREQPKVKLSDSEVTAMTNIWFYKSVYLLASIQMTVGGNPSRSHGGVLLAYYLIPHSLFSLLSYSTEEHQPKGWHHPQWVGPSHQSRKYTTGLFLSQYDQGIQVDLKPASTAQCSPSPSIPPHYCRWCPQTVHLSNPPALESLTGSSGSPAQG